MHSEHTWPARARTPRERQEDYCVALLMKGERLWTSAEISRDHGVVSSRTRHVAAAVASGGLGTARDRSGPLGTHGDAWGRGGRTRGRRLRKVEVPVGTLRVRLPRVRVVRRSGSHACTRCTARRAASRASALTCRPRAKASRSPSARRCSGRSCATAAPKPSSRMYRYLEARCARAAACSGPLGTARDRSGRLGAGRDARDGGGRV